VPPEMVSGLLAARLARLGVELRAREPVVLVATATAVLERARHNLTAARHPYGTPTPARPGGPPAMISGTLAGALALTKPVMTPLGMILHVGVKSGVYPPYGRGKKTEAAKYGYYLEVTGAGRSRVRYPWLMPAVHAVGHTAATASLRSAFFGFGRY
jgi:hypothetical protein